MDLDAEQVAGEVVADRDHVAARRLLEEERVEGHDLVDVGRRHLEQAGHVLLDLERHVAEDLLGQAQHGQQRALLVRVEGLEAADFGSCSAVNSAAWVSIRRLGRQVGS